MRYLATLLGSTDEQTMRWFILVVALLLDPAAVLLLLVSTERPLLLPDIGLARNKQTNNEIR